MTIQPQTEAATLFNKIVESSNHPPVSELEIKCFESDLEGIKENHRALYYSAKGILSSVKGNIKDLHHNHQLAIKLQPQDPLLIKSYATDLSNMGFYDEACVQWKEVAEMTDYASPEIVQGLIRAYCFSGQIVKAISTYDQLLRLNAPMII